ncbi:hypothetical protein [Rufibacter tibetensis]|uniref:hypothetical protein n=1 Tax=Rufibacter tibetensis TaxID=512763 RepID=UPI0012F7E0E8|nr:hypothetical protein [Rufibacter tibetensis]
MAKVLAWRASIRLARIFLSFLFSKAKETPMLIQRMPIGEKCSSNKTYIGIFTFSHGRIIPSGAVQIPKAISATLIQAGSTFDWIEVMLRRMALANMVRQATGMAYKTIWLVTVKARKPVIEARNATTPKNRAAYFRGFILGE